MSDAAALGVAAARAARPRAIAIPGSSPSSSRIATFMEVLDTSIANVSLRHIAGSLAASVDESTWVITTYLVANAVVLPISGWLSDRDRAQALLHAVRRACSPSPRCCAGLRRASRAADRLSRPAGHRRRRHGDQRAGDPGRHVPAGEARAGVRALRHRRHRRAGGRPDARRLDHRQFLLALDLLHQRAGRPVSLVAGAVAGGGAAGARARTAGAAGEAD